MGQPPVFYSNGKSHIFCCAHTKRNVNEQMNVIQTQKLKPAPISEVDKERRHGFSRLLSLYQFDNGFFITIKKFTINYFFLRMSNNAALANVIATKPVIGEKSPVFTAFVLIIMDSCPV